MDDIVERLRGYKPYRIGEGEWFGPKVCEEAAAAIESLRAENARLTEERDALVEGLRWYAEPHIYAPHPNGPAFDDRDLSWHAKSILAKVKGGPDAR